MYITKKKIKDHDYYYLRQSVREHGKVKTKNIAYLGKDLKEARKKAKEIIRNNEKKNKENVVFKSKLEHKKISINELAVFCKRKSFVYPSAEIYGGYAGFWDFGPIGVEFRNNIKQGWWNYHVQNREDIVGIDGSIITNPKVWEASGHVQSFSDVIAKCKKCGKFVKIDKHEINKGVKCFCGGELDFENANDFNLMFTTKVGPIGQVEDDDKNSIVYLRPETAQLIFADFKLVQENARLKLPFGIAQIGKVFRNEIAPRNFLFRSREFEQMEIEYFIQPNSECKYKIPDINVLIFSSDMQKKNKEAEKMKIKDALFKKIIKHKWHAYWLAVELNWFVSLGCDINNFRLRQHLKDELAHYSSDCWDIEYNFPFGWKELQGIADRGNFDLSQHEKFSNKDLKIFDQKSGKKILPHVIAEPSLGLDRSFLVFLFDAYYYDKARGNIVLKLHPKLAPIKAAIFPIIKKPEYEKMTLEIFKDLSKEFNVIYDKSGSIGRRYARNDEIGTPFCITIDDKSPNQEDVTIRFRDTTEQIRVKIKDLKEILRKLILEEEKFEKIGKKVSTRIK